MGQSQSQPYLNYNSALVENLKSVGQAKNKRTEIEKDVELLHNRIKMLQMEEHRAMKKIEETRK
jgi:chaperonin cofactor prefoldin